MMNPEFEKNYQNFKEKMKEKNTSTGKGKLTPYKELIEKMIDDDISQKDIREHLEEQYHVKISINSLFLFVKKLKEKKIIKMELVNGTNFVAAPTTPIKEKKIKPTNIPASENETNKPSTVVEINKDEPIANSNIVKFKGVEYNINTSFGRMELDLAKIKDKDSKNV